MYKSFKEIEQKIVFNQKRFRVALAGAHDSEALEAVVTARRRGVINCTLIGHKVEILSLLAEFNEDVNDYDIVPCEDEVECARTAFSMVKSGEADLPMKGLMQTATFMRCILDKQYGFLGSGDLLSQATVLEYRQQDRMMVISDCAVNIAPDFDDKVKIIKNAVKLANCLGCDNPKVALVTALETVNPSIPSTVEAAMLTQAAARGQIKGCMVDGPLGLDNAINMEAAKHKGIESSVAGNADLLIMPDLVAGNIFTKSLTYFANLPSSGTLNGTKSPVIMTSRSDTPENKYYSILTALLQALQ